MQRVQKASRPVVARYSALFPRAAVTTMDRQILSLTEVS